jgi:enterochelin esterase-like enzyme
VPVYFNPDGESVTFELPDRARRLTAVRLVQEIGLPGPLDLVRRLGAWRIDVVPPAVARLEYLFEIEDHNGHRSTIPDPGNPHRVGAAFGDKSVVEFADYRAPAWLAVEPVPSTETTIEVDAPELDGSVTATVWAPQDLDAGRPTPLVIVHDGPEYAELGGLTHYLGAAVARGDVPPVRAALLDPGDRNDWYSANPDYARALCGQVLPALDEVAPATGRIGLGVSLGGLAMLHAHRGCPGAFAALLLQSGSFFCAELDPQEREFAGFAAVSAFVEQTATAGSDPAPVPTVVTCGTVEENRANNEAMARHLRRLGYPVEFVAVRDAHNYTAWRDALDPYLARLVHEVVSDRAA